MTTLPTVVTLGGVTVGLAVLVWVGIRWWLRQRPKWAALLPYAFATLHGMLLILAAGGILGGAADWALWGTSIAGDAGLEYGVGGGSPEVTRDYADALTDGGHAVLALATVALVAIFKFAKKLPSRDILLGELTGICLGMADGVAGWAAAGLARGANWLGDWVGGML